MLAVWFYISLLWCYHLASATQLRVETILADSTDSSDNVGAIVGGIIGGVVGLALIGFIGYLVYRYFSSNDESEPVLVSDSTVALKIPQTKEKKSTYEQISQEDDEVRITIKQDEPSIQLEQVQQPKKKKKDEPKEKLPSTQLEEEKPKKKKKDELPPTQLEEVQKPKKKKDLEDSEKPAERDSKKSKKETKGKIFLNVDEDSSDEDQPSVKISSSQKKRPPRNFNQQTKDNLIATAKKNSLAVVPVGNGAYKVYDTHDPNSKVVILDEATLKYIFPNADLSGVDEGLKCAATGDENPLGPGAESFLTLLHDQVDKVWNAPKKVDKSLQMDKPWLKDLSKKFNPGAPPFRVPKNITETNIPVRLLENVADYTMTTMASIKVNEKLADFAIKKDQVWNKIPLPILGNTFIQESATIKYFIEDMGVTSLVSDKDGNLRADFGGDLQATFVKKDKKKPWYAGNTEIVEKNKGDKWYTKLRSEAFNLVTVRDHLCYAHLTFSNYLYQAVYKLSDSILYPLLFPHTLGSNEKNSDAYWNLYNGRGILLAAAGEVDNHPYILGEFENGRGQYLKNIQTFPEWLEDNKAFCTTKYVVRGEFFYEQIQQYVSGYFSDMNVEESTFIHKKYIKFWAKIQEMLGESSILPTKENVEKWIVELIWRVTYFHYQVGNALPYLYDCDFIKWDRSDYPSNDALWSLLVGFATSSRQYQLIKFKYGDGPLGDRYRAMIEALVNYKPDGFNDNHVEGIPQWVWELEPSVAR